MRFLDPRSGKAKTTTMTLLIVEDNPEMRRLVRSLVAKRADAVYECNDGSQALAAYREQRPDWVLMDIQMPVMDGIAATRLIKTAIPEARIVMLTQYDYAEMREAAREAGAVGDLLKDELFKLHAMFGE
jgi:two-component system NarL family response regulator